MSSVTTSATRSRRQVSYDFVINPDFSTSRRPDEYFNYNIFEPLRIELDFGGIETTNINKIKLVKFLANEATRLWSKILKLYPDKFEFPINATCSERQESFLRDHIDSFDHALFVISSDDENCGVAVKGHACAGHPLTERPVGSVLQFCTSLLKMSDLKQTIREVGYILGLDPKLWTSWFSRETHQLQTLTSTDVEGCDKGIRMPDQDTLRNGKLITPLARQVVANHLDCQSLQGIPLDEGHCLGDPKLLWNEHSVYPTPLALAMLEDSAWYSAQYEFSVTQSEGYGKGCDYFESKSTDEVGTRKKMMCDSSYHQVLDCPWNEEDCRTAIDCSMDHQLIAMMRSNQFSLPDEKFGHSSRCFETNWDRGVCLQTSCDRRKQLAVVNVNGKEYTCSINEEHYPFRDDDVIEFKCPPLKTLCPNFFCPANCAGRGVCEWSRGQTCKCFDSENNSPSCTFENVALGQSEQYIFTAKISGVHQISNSMIMGIFVFLSVIIFL